MRRWRLQKVVKVEQSPEKPRRWLHTFECGHAEWRIRAKPFKIGKAVICIECSVEAIDAEKKPKP